MDCPNCSKEFVQNRPYQIYCSRKCLEKYHNDRAKKQGSDCKICGIHFEGRNGQRYCTPECKKQARQDTTWAATLKYKYGITPDEYVTMVFEQGGLCAICKKPETQKHKNGKTLILSVDHCHTTGKVRGLLCHRCNKAIGLLDDSPELLDRAKAHISKERI